MKKDDMPHHYREEATIQGFGKTLRWHNSIRKQIRYITLALRQVGNFEQFHKSTYQCSILFNDNGFFQTEEWILKITELEQSYCTKKRKVQCHVSVTSSRVLVKQLCTCDVDSWGRQFANRCKGTIVRLWLGGMPLNEGQLSACSCKNWLHRICSTPVGIEWWKDRSSHAAIFEVKFGQRSDGLHTDSRERTADTLFSDLESVNLVIEDIATKGNFVPTADCLRDTKDHSLVTRSGL